MGSWRRNLTLLAAAATCALAACSPQAATEARQTASAAPTAPQVHAVSGLELIPVTVKTGEEVAFIAEVQQAGIFLIKGLEAAAMSHTLGAFCPNILFPYAREALDSLVTRGSFPALMLAPVNFDALYAQEMARMQGAGEAPSTAH